MVGSEGGGPRDEFFLPTVGGAARSLLDGRKRAMSEAHRDEGGAGGASHAARAKGGSKLSAGRPRTTLQQQQQASEGRYERTTGSARSAGGSGSGSGLAKMYAQPWANAGKGV